MLGKLLFILIPVATVMGTGMCALIDYWQDEYGKDVLDIDWSDFTREDGAKVFLLIIISILMGVISNLVYVTLHGGISV